MTEVSRHHQPDTRPVFVGTRAEAVAMLRTARAAGVLISYTQPVPAPGAPGRVMLRVQLAERPRPPTPSAGPLPNTAAVSRWHASRMAAHDPKRQQRRRRRKVALAAAGGVGLAAVLGAAGWAVWTLIAWAAAHAAVIAGVLILTALTVIGLGRLGVCPGIHCPGCRHH